MAAAVGLDAAKDLEGERSSMEVPRYIDEYQG